MNLKLLRICSRPDWTIGVLLRTDLSGPRFLCSTLEDEFHVAKIAGETRIPAGTYEILLRDEGGLTQKYAQNFPDIHRGMLWLQDVPGFKYIYIHVGNDDSDTEGCILIGKAADYGAGSIYQSRDAYKEVYPLLANEIASGNQVFITIEDIA